MTRTMAYVYYLLHVEKRREMCSKHRRIVRTEMRGSLVVGAKPQRRTTAQLGWGGDDTRPGKTDCGIPVLETDAVITTVVFWMVILHALVITYSA